MEKKIPFEIQLHDKTLPQLREMLHFHEKVLSNKKVLSSLPDKGEKMKHSVKVLLQAIAEKLKSEDCSTEVHTIGSVPIMSDQKTLPAYYGSATRPLQSKEVPAVSLSTSRENVPRCFDSNSGTLAGNITTHQQEVNSDLSTSLSACLENLHVSKTVISNSDVVEAAEMGVLFPNSYENIMRRHKDHQPKKESFKPNRSLKIADIDHLPEQYKLKSRKANQNPGDLETESTSKGSNQTSRVHHKEESGVSPLDYKFKSAMEISVEDSIRLQKEQREQYEAVQLQHATERLAAKLNIKAINYNPPEVDMSYRSGVYGQNDDNSSSDSNEELSEVEQ